MQRHSTHTRHAVAQRRRQRLRAASATPVSKAAILELFHRADFRCAYCQTQSYDLTVDHAIPIARGGPHNLGNLVPCCRSCNSRKGTRTPEEFATYLRATANEAPPKHPEAALLGGSGSWMTAPMAARALGINERSVRRRAATGQLLARRHGGRMLIWLPDDDIADDAGKSNGTGGTPAVAGNPDSAVLALERLASAALARAEASESRTAGLYATVARWQERIGALQAEMEHVCPRSAPSQ